ncbi:metallophosphoesterase [Xanthomonas phage JGB6]|nr:metallophosphoesterase [Xanthomonas phage JGB6]
MNRIFRSIAVVALALGMVACSKVEPGNIGIRVSNFGERGVQGELVEAGKYVYNGPGYQMYEFPLFKQNHVYDGDQSIIFSTVEV